MKLQRTLSVNIKIYIHSKNGRVVTLDFALGHVFTDLSYAITTMYFLDLKDYNLDILQELR